MSKVKSIIEVLISVISLSAIVWGLPELIVNIFKIEDDGTKSYIRWTVIVLLTIFGSLFRIFYPNLDKKDT